MLLSMQYHHIQWKLHKHCRHRTSLIIVTLAAISLFALHALLLTIPDDSLSPVHMYRTIVASETSEEFASSLSYVAQQTTESKGIVLPLFDGIAALGLSLIAELRALGVDLPIEVPHCGDLSVSFQDMLIERHSNNNYSTNVRVYDACSLAANATGVSNPYKKLFCWNLRHCQQKFRSFDIKVLAVIYSRFQEVMLVDADTLFFQSPMALWETQKYQETGTLFFYDRISSDTKYLAERFRGQKKVSLLHHFLSKFDVTPYHQLPTIRRAKTERTFKMLFEPSTFLLTSNVWNLRSGHEMDSSLVLWNKTKQPRATAILASFIALNDHERPNSYGDKEFFFLACELAETMYEFSDFAVGAIGSELHEKESALCGDALHYFPVRGVDDVNATNGELLYLNSDNIMNWNPTKQSYYRTASRSAMFYPGSFTDRNLPPTCPFDITPVKLTDAQVNRLVHRQKLYEATDVGKMLSWSFFGRR